MAVRFRKAWRMYQPGEVAGFDAKIEADLIQSGLAQALSAQVADVLIEADTAAQAPANDAQTVPALEPVPDVAEPTAKAKGK